MVEEEFARLRPRDLAAVWGTAVGQLTDLVRAVWTALLEAGSGERRVSGDQVDVVVVPTEGGAVPDLVVGRLTGESWGQVIDGGLVVFSAGDLLADGRVRFECHVDEVAGQPIVGDIYRGQVVDGAGNVVASIALDAGS